MLTTLRAEGALSRAALARRVGLSRTTLSEITADLLARGAIVVVDTDSATRRGSGRPAERLALDPAAAQFLGVDFGHRRVHVAVADASHTIIAAGMERYPDGFAWDRRVELAFDLIARVSSRHSVHLDALQGIGIGVPGPYAGPGAGGPHLTWRRHPAPERVDEAFAERFDAPVAVDNNTRLAALAEAATQAGSPGDLLYVRLSDGVGGGLVVSGRLITGARGLAGELGHVTAVPGGAKCRCGKRGCLETVASAPAILSAVRRQGVQVHSITDLAAAVAREDAAADAALREVGSTLGRTLGAAAMVLNPGEVVIGGEVARAAPVLVQQAAAVVHRELYPVSTAQPVTVRAGRLRDSDGARGALAAVFHQSPLLADYPHLDQETPMSPRRRAQ
ncbi:MAG TPA: ROK family transcriptional regulator [Candidatus Ruania gallistercoris]|uniref:ROK family transcriptional regulator n=1 Tax=Candidatus Ruania gallistercoris TaxID=2838746 RepID=A0A9D2J5U6_9MICO|nr:ROK family transcriptional regulator [Candidatus Ruania gallistercoris]